MDKYFSGLMFLTFLGLAVAGMKFVQAFALVVPQQVEAAQMEVSNVQPYIRKTEYILEATVPNRDVFRLRRRGQRPVK